MSMNHGVLVLKNYMLNTLVQLLNVPVAGQAARARNRFLQALKGAADELEAKRMELLKKYGDLKDGELQIENGHYKLTDKEAFDKEFADLQEGTLALQCKAEQLIDFQAVHRILNTLETKLTVDQTTVYDAICNSFDEWAKSQQAPQID